MRRYLEIRGTDTNIGIILMTISRERELYIRKITKELDQIAGDLIAWRRHLHQNPELSGQEFATTDFLSQQLSVGGVNHRIVPTGRGIIAESTYVDDPSAPLISFRADIDALPIYEESRASYRSTRDGVMHACGHDAHTAILLGTTLAFQRAGSLPVRWRSIFQPAEESGNGARQMIEFGALKDAQAIIAVHVDPTRPVGWVGVIPGPRTAFCQDFEIRIKGRGGHAARPHLAIDPIAAAAQLVTTVYQNIPRATDARAPVVVTIGMLSAGSTSNVIPDAALLKGTIRAVEQTVVEHARDILQRICDGAALSSGAQVEPFFERPLNGLTNDPRVTGFCAVAAREMTQEGHLIEQDLPSMGAEDFADYVATVPGCMMTLGTRIENSPITPVHTPRFDIDEGVLMFGARLLARVLLQWASAH
jgi:amidohydrolase